MNQEDNTKNRICEISGIEKPIIQGPMVWLTDAKLVASVSEAGGLGSLGPNAGWTVPLNPDVCGEFAFRDHKILLP